MCGRKINNGLAFIEEKAKAAKPEILSMLSGLIQLKLNSESPYLQGDSEFFFIMRLSKTGFYHMKIN